MKKKNPIKKNMSSTQVLKTLLVLISGDYTMAELVQKLNENEQTPVFNNSVVSKYINTCRCCGIKIPKINNRYYVTELPFGLDFTQTECELIEYLQDYAKQYLSVPKNKDLDVFIKKLNKYSNKKITNIEPGSISMVNKIFEQALLDKRKILLMLKDKNSIECIPLDIFEDNGRQYFHVSYNDKERNIALDRVSGLRILQERFGRIKDEGSIVYKMTGVLAKNYTIRENERIVTNELPESLTVVNDNNNTPMLLSRLFKYGELCELRTPKNTRLLFKDMIDETLANYGE